MRFQLDEEYELTRSAVRDFADAEVARGAADRDEFERVDRDLFKSMAEMGLTGIPIAERWGGAGSDALAYAIVLEELARVCASTAAVLHAHTMASWVVSQYGQHELREEKLTPLTTGARMGTLAVCDQPLRLKRLAQSSYQLNGCISSVDLAGTADDYILLVKHRNGRLSLGVAPAHAGSSGISMGPTANKLGLRGVPSANLQFNSGICSLFNVVKESNGQSELAADSHIINAINEMREIGLAAQATGIAQGALEAALAYAKERTQFGKPIGLQQGIAFKLADMAANVEASRWLVYEAAWLRDRGKEGSGKAAMAKLFAIKHAAAIAVEAVQIFGGYGYMREYRVERYLRDAKSLEAGGENSYSAILASLEAE
ncbi:acyl-CoA dehydrogenase family protein [Paenibacillus glycanilyticus]|uniref:acyl-CoA dehydrogenase family protein n=1 Tax=Paenibacillus glycanilyticus TaxID=126569 RepID=UPI0020415B77|nr:acyl-CoA dehydrogenase family protein [Paenibacillus glycanilyticus]MCM3628617.1 acyl-CoA dehydrogenase family protein [Paenibacillus glycanilyticus]